MSCSNLEEILGNPLNFSGNTNAFNNTLINCPKLVTIKFVPNCINKTLSPNQSPLLSDTSLISIANGLDGSVSGQSLGLHTTPKNRCSEIIGSITNGIFEIDTNGNTTLTDFITETKGWTLA